MLHFDFKAIIALQGYHVYKETAWSDTKVNDKVKIEIETNQSSITIDPYACTVKIGLSRFKKFVSIYFNGSPLKMMKNAFYFMLKAYFVLDIFTSLL